VQITDKLETTREYEKAAFPRAQAEAMAEIHEQHAGLNLEAVRAIIASDLEAKMDKNFASLRTEIQTVARDQTWRFIGFVFAIAATSVTVATLLFAVVRK
jgi:predicted unusual protein kinase regulating ubiquinone biosynthesis (AarF/ABC1/UbiB family)